MELLNHILDMMSKIWTLYIRIYSWCANIYVCVCVFMWLWVYECMFVCLNITWFLNKKLTGPQMWHSTLTGPRRWLTQHTGPLKWTRYTQLTMKVARYTYWTMSVTWHTWWTTTKMTWHTRWTMKVNMTLGDLCWWPWLTQWWYCRRDGSYGQNGSG